MKLLRAAICLLSLSIIHVAAQIHWPAPDPKSDYVRRVQKEFSNRAERASVSLANAGFIPRETFTNQSFRLAGQAVEPRGNIRFSACDYEFFQGSLRGITRTDLFEDRGPASLIIPHLTNSVLKLHVKAAPGRAWTLLHVLGFDTNRLMKAYRVRVETDKMDAHPVRNAGPDFPADLHFFGELISREKIRIKVELTPVNTQALENSRFSGRMNIEFLATTGELLSARLAEPEALSELGIASAPRFIIQHAADFTPPIYYFAERKLGQASPVTPEVVSRLIGDTWNDLNRKIGTNRPSLFLIADNLNATETVVGSMNRLTGKTPWAGMSRMWRDDLPFDRKVMNRLAAEHRGIALLAISGTAQLQMECLTKIPPSGFPGYDEAGKKKERVLRGQLEQGVSALTNRLRFPEKFPDHIVLLLQPGASYSSRLISDQLNGQLRGRARVVDLIGEREFFSVGSGWTYFGGVARSNAMLAIRLSGFLPLTMDFNSILRRQPERRIVSDEAIEPITKLAYGYGPNPLEELFNRFGDRGLRILREADRVTVFQIKPNIPDNWSEPGKPAIDGHEIMGRGVTRDRNFTRRLSAVILNEQNSLGSSVGKTCVWSPRIALVASHGKETATFLVCFECNALTIRFRDANQKPVGEVSLDFDMNRRQLLELVRDALPAATGLGGD